MTRRNSIYCLAVLCCLLAACYSSGNPSVMNQELVSQIKIGISTKEDVQRLLGPPNGTSRGASSFQFPTLGKVNSAYEFWNYTRISVETNATTFIPIVGLFAGGATSQVASFTVGFDEKGIVQHISTHQNQATIGPGAQ